MASFDVGEAVIYNRKQWDEPDVQRAFALVMAHWQEQHALDVDGKLGPRTLRSILDALGVAPIEDQELEADHEDEVSEDAPIAIDDAGWAAGADVHRIPSARSQTLVHRDSSGPAPAGIVWHWTATNEGTGWACARRIAQAPKPGERSASWHVLITRAGEVLQSIPFRRGSWHAGGQSAKRFAKHGDRWTIDAAGTLSANALMIGIELENVGEVREHDGQWMGWPFGKDGKKGPVVPAGAVRQSGSKFFHDFTEAQERAARRVLRALADEYRIDVASSSFGHVDIDPTRKTDPGPLWKKHVLPRIQAAVYGGTPGGVPG